MPSGILDVACSVVDVLQRYFPEYMDKLPRESAFFKGPLPSLLHSHREEDILNLVMASGSAGTQEVLPHNINPLCSYRKSC